MKRRSLLDDEIPLTHKSSPSRSVTQETRSKFDALLKAALNQEKSQKKKQSSKRETSIELIETNSQQQITITPRLRETKLEPIPSTSRAVEIISTSEDDVISSRELAKTSSNRNLLPKINARKKSKRKDKSIATIHKSQRNQSTNETKVANFGSSSDEDIAERNPSPVRRLSYVIEMAKKEPASPITSPFKEIPPHPSSRPVPKPRQRHGLNEQSPLRNSLANDEATSPKAPPLYSKTTASYENLERDGGSLHSLHRRSRSREEIEMAEFNPKLAAPVASYEEISSIQRTRKPENESEENLRSPARSTSTPAVDPRLPRYEEVIGVWVHKTDRLKVDPLVCRPLVKVHVVDIATGTYLKKSDPSRAVAYFHENALVDYVAPLMTHEFDFNERRSIIPAWEELLVFNDDISCILNHDKPVIIFFEILNSVSFSLASSRYKRLGSDGCWLCIAWAFLKPTAANGATNVGAPLRLQLYEPGSERRPAARTCAAFAWWRRGTRVKFSGSLHVTVKPIRPPHDLARVLRSQLATQGELVSSQDPAPSDSPTAPTAPTASTAPDLAAPASDWRSPWSRMPGQSCKLPNAVIARDVAVGSDGCFVVAFSRAGRRLACATSGRDGEHVVVVAHIPDGRPGPGPAPMRLAGHRALVYDLDWSADDVSLLTASADRTACVWDVATGDLKQLLPHPAFVYCARFSPGSREPCIVTGCSDNVVRVWGKTSDADLFLLLEELEEHTGFVTSMCFDLSGGLISADSVGRILVWPSVERRKTLTPRELRVRELRDVVINAVACHPGGKRLLVHARDSLLRMLDLATGSVIQWFHGALNYRVQTQACMSPCGGLVFAASETGTVCVWDADTGEPTAIYAALGFHRGASAVAFHPREHVAAFCSGGTPNGVVLTAFDKSADGKQLGLQLLGRRALAGSEPKRDAAEERAELETLDRSAMSSDDFSRRKVPAPCVVDLAGNLSASKAEPHADSGGDRLKLVDIIERMDKVFLSTTPSKCSGHISANSTPGRVSGKNEDARSRRRSVNSQRAQLEGRN